MDDKNGGLAFAIQSKLNEIGIPVCAYQAQGETLKLNLVKKGVQTP